MTPAQFKKLHLEISNIRDRARAIEDEVTAAYRGKFVKVGDSVYQIDSSCNVFNSISARGYRQKIDGSFERRRAQFHFMPENVVDGPVVLSEDDKLLLRKGFGPKSYWGKTGTIVGVGPVTRENLLANLRGTP